MISQLFDGAAKPVQLALREHTSRLIDRWLDIETTDETVALSLGIDIQDFRMRQRALGWSGAIRVVRRLNLQPSDVFLDLGCGAGRILCAAALSRVGGAIGLDIDPRMTGLASKNVERLRRRTAPVEVITADATTYSVPDRVTAVFLYNPFGGEVLTRALQQIIDSADRSPRRIRVAYANPAEHDRVLGLKRFVPGERISLGWRPREDWGLTLKVQFYNLDRRTDLAQAHYS